MSPTPPRPRMLDWQHAEPPSNPRLRPQHLQPPVQRQRRPGLRRARPAEPLHPPRPARKDVRAGREHRPRRSRVRHPRVRNPARRQAGHRHCGLGCEVRCCVRGCYGLSELLLEEGDGRVQDT